MQQLLNKVLLHLTYQDNFQTLINERILFKVYFSVDLHPYSFRFLKKSYKYRIMGYFYCCEFYAFGQKTQNDYDINIHLYMYMNALSTQKYLTIKLVTKQV